METKFLILVSEVALAHISCGFLSFRFSLIIFKWEPFFYWRHQVSFAASRYWKWGSVWQNTDSGNYGRILRHLPCFIVYLFFGNYSVCKIYTLWWKYIYFTIISVLAWKIDNAFLAVVSSKFITSERRKIIVLSLLSVISKIFLIFSVILLVLQSRVLWNTWD